MKNLGIIGIAATILGLIILFNSAFIVDQRQQALVLQLGASKEIYNTPNQNEPGLKFKIPFVQDVVFYDKRNLGLNISDSEVYASNQELLLVDAFVRWRVSDPLAFYQTQGTISEGELTLEGFTDTALRKAVATRLPEEVISGDRAALMDEIRDDLRRSVSSERGNLGIEIIDVRIRRADLPQDVSQRVYDRMKAARNQQAAQRRAEGEERAKLIEATAQREKTVILAEANRDAERIRGEGDAQRNAIYADAYEKDAEFFRFQRALIACEQAYSQGTRLVIAPDNLGLCDEFIRRARDAGRPSR